MAEFRIGNSYLSKAISPSAVPGKLCHSSTREIRRAEQRIDEMGKGPLRVPVTGGVQSYKVHAWVAIALMITACSAWGGRMTWR